VDGAADGEHRVSSVRTRLPVASPGQSKERSMFAERGHAGADVRLAQFQQQLAVGAQLFERARADR